MAVYPSNWWNPMPEPFWRWKWQFSIGPWKWQKPGGMLDTPGACEAALREAWAAFLDKFGLEEGLGGARRQGTLTLRRGRDPNLRSAQDYDIIVAGEVLGRLRYPEAQPPRWGSSVWLEPLGGDQNGLDDSREEAMTLIRAKWDRWLKEYGLQERI